MRLYAIGGCKVAGLGLAVILLLLPTGCRTTTRSGLPSHIRTVEVHIFQNKTMYKGIEGLVTRNIIDRIAGDPVVRLSSHGGDALITGEITAVNRTTLRETTTNEPGTVLISITAKYSFYDEVKRRYIKEDVTVHSTQTAMARGVYESSQGDTSSSSERAAAKLVADEIVRQTIGMW